MTYEQLLDFILNKMRMAHVYQPVMIRHLLESNGRSDTASIAKQLLLEDQSQIEYYSQITNNMVGRVLRRREIVEKDKNSYELAGYPELSQDEIQALMKACNQRLSEYIDSRGKAIWEHRTKSKGYITGTIRYEVLKAAKFHCELCGISADEKALEVDHIIPRNKGGSDEIANLQALCYSCNAMKRDRDDTDFRLVRAAFEKKKDDCPFCHHEDREMLFENSLAVAFKDLFPVSEGHILIVPKRHEPDYFELGNPEVRACNDLLKHAKERLQKLDKAISGFNVGINCGATAGQTVMHCHTHLIPRREGDHAKPRGGVRAVIPGKTDY